MKIFSEMPPFAMMMPERMNRGSGQDAGTVTSTNDASEHELYVAGKIRVNESGGHSGTDEGQNQRESHQDAYNKNNDNS